MCPVRTNNEIFDKPTSYLVSIKLYTSFCLRQFLCWHVWHYQPDDTSLWLTDCLLHSILRTPQLTFNTQTVPQEQSWHSTESKPWFTHLQCKSFDSSVNAFLYKMSHLWEVPVLTLLLTWQDTANKGCADFPTAYVTCVLCSEKLGSVALVVCIFPKWLLLCCLLTPSCFKM